MRLSTIRFAGACLRRALLGLGTTSAAALVLLAAGSGPARAGGPIGLTSTGLPLHHDRFRPVSYAVDAGPLGTRSHAAGAALVERAFQVWQDLPLASIEFESAGDLSQDINGRNVLSFLNGLRPMDPSPIFFDSDGSITDTLRGRGASQTITAFAGTVLANIRTGEISVGLAVLNARLFPSHTEEHLLWVISHEFGHLLGLHHSQINSEVKYDGDPDNDSLTPTMFYRGPNGRPGLQQDDLSWISWLYPSNDFASRTGSIHGRVLLPDGKTGLQGIHVIARRVGDPQVTAVGCISGFIFRNSSGGVLDPARQGEFLLPGLPPGSYTVEVQELDSYPNVSVAGVFLVGGPKFWREGSSAQDRVTDFTPIVVNAGQEVKGIDLVLNGEDLGEPRQVTEVEPNLLSSPQRITLPAIISGEAEESAGDTAGPLIDEAELEDQLHDVYRITLREPTILTLILTAARRATDLDLYVTAEDSQGHFIVTGSIASGTPPESLQFRLPEGRYHIGVHRSSERGSAYTLQILATPAPVPEVEPDFALISYVLLGDITETGALARWETTSASPSVVVYNQPQREVGSLQRQRQHSQALTGLAAGSRTDVEVYSQAGPRFTQVDQVVAPLTTATAPAPDGAPRVVAGSTATMLSSTLAQVVVRLTNAGDGDALQVRIDQITPATGWESVSTAIFGTPIPDKLEVGKIGPEGSGSLVILMIRVRGTAAARVSVNGTYTDAAGTALKF